MIQYDSQNTFKEIHYNGYDIKKVYGGNHLVWEKESPVPPTPSDGKYKLILNDSSVITAECDSTSAITSAETLVYSATCVSLEIGNCITSIGDRCFYSYSNLTNAVISDSVMNIGNGAFMDCTNLENVEMSNNVTSLDDNAFNYCVKLKNITLPSSITSIGNGAFYFCKALISVVCEATIPPSIGVLAFNNTSQDLVIYVPAQSVSTYQSAWSNYSSKIQPIPT